MARLALHSAWKNRDLMRDTQLLKLREMQSDQHNQKCFYVCMFPPILLLPYLAFPVANEAVSSDNSASGRMARRSCLKRQATDNLSRQGHSSAA